MKRKIHEIEADLDPSGLLEDDLPLPFVNASPVEWSCHGLRARAACSVKHGNEKYWVTYCPSNGMATHLMGLLMI